MDLNWIWKSVLIVIAGTMLLRLAGRKSISQMTLTQTVIMIGIGSLLVQPLAGHKLWTTIGVGTVLVLTLIVMEYAQLKSDRVETWITGKAKILVENGILQVKTLKKLRLTVDQLEMKLRQQNIASIQDVEWATLEPNGQVACQLKKGMRSATKRDIDMLMEELKHVKEALGVSERANFDKPLPEDHSIFGEIKDHKHKYEPPEHLQ